MEQFLLPLAIVLIAAEAGGYLSDRMGLTRVSGQIAAGLVVGPSLLGLVQLDGDLQMLAGVGALCVLAIAGLETDTAGIRAVGRPATLAAIGGVVLPFLGGTVVASMLGVDLAGSVFVGAILTATSVGVSAAALRELGLSGSRAGQTILGAAVIDDILGLAVLSLVIAMTGKGDPSTTVIHFGGMVAVLVGAGIGLWLVRGWLPELLHRLHLRGGGLAGLVGLMLVLAWVFQTWGGLAGITGAYVAGLAVAGTHVADKLKERLVHAGEAFVVPVFLVAIGLSVDLRAGSGIVVPMLLLLAVGVAGKVVGSGIGARMGGLDAHTSTGVGVGMIARGEVALVAASLGLQSGIIDQTMYSACVVMALATTVITPVLLAGWAARPRVASMLSEQRLMGVVAPMPATVDAE